MLFPVLLALVSLLAGGVAAVVGFGIGSLLTPTLAIQTGTKLAVAAVAIPHFVDRCSASGCCAPTSIAACSSDSASRAPRWPGRRAPAHARIDRGLAIVFGDCSLSPESRSCRTGFQKVRWGRRAAVGRRCAVRSVRRTCRRPGRHSLRRNARLRRPRTSFVATATAIALFVDAARLPVYVATQWRAIAGAWPFVLDLDAWRRARNRVRHSRARANPGAGVPAVHRGVPARTRPVYGSGRRQVRRDSGRLCGSPPP